MKLNYVKQKLSNIISISKIVTIHQYNFDKDFRFEGESHDFWEMVYVQKGRVHITAGSKSFFLKQGQVAFHKPNEFHTINADGVNSADVFVIAFVCSSKAMAFFKSKNATVPSALKKLLASLIDESLNLFTPLPVTGVELKIKDDTPIGSPQLLRMHLEEFLIMMIREESIQDDLTFFVNKESMENHLVSQMIDIIEKNVYKRISCAEVCDEMNYSRTYLSKIFKASTNYTISEYITHLKIRESKKLIRAKCYNFTQISDMLHFDNPHYFSRVFKKVTKITPSQYKNSVQR